MRILLIDDDIELGQLLSEYLEQEGFAVDLAHDGETGLAQALAGGHAAVVLDVMLPRLSGIEVLRRIRAGSQVPVIMLTAKGDKVERVVGLELGADDYVPKPCYPRELAARLRAVLRRSGPAATADTSDIQRGDLSLSPGRRAACWQSTALELTVTEFNLLELLMRAGDLVLSKDELSERLLGRPRLPYDRSIDVHVSNLRQKLLAASGDEQLVQTVRGIGYRLCLPP